jgi:Fur family transcriptional regulator, ferric uptake regulator
MAGNPTESDSTGDTLADLAAQLRHGSRRVTGAREAILDSLRRERRPMTAREVSESLRLTKCDLATVYRSLGMLQELCLVQRFDFGDGIARYELIGEHGHGHHHHHLVCQRCSRVVEIQDCFPAEMEQAIARRNGFKKVTHRLEFFGLCPTCQ